MLLLLGCLGAAAGSDPCAGLPPVDGFDFPVGPPEATNYYDAQPFGDNAHLGSDWNGKGGGNSDLGDPVFAAAAGRVALAEDLERGWGQVVRVLHRDGAACRETVYAHLDRIEVVPGQVLARGERLGTIGTAGGQYWAHLHFELRERPGTDIGGGYGSPDAQVDPTAFILAHRPR